MINKGAQSLPPKDAQAYKQLAKFYDAKNYKKGLKNTEKLLETHPDHPETNALKALFLQAVGEDSKALEIAKLSLLKSKMKSMFCWHTCGTIYKQKKDFIEASKCFQNALKSEPDNLQLMRDTACLQIQVRDHANHVASRFSILKMKPNMIQHWVAFALAHHLRGDFPSLFKALTSLDNLVKTADLKQTELAHYYLYKVIAYRDAQKYDLVYEELNKSKDKIKDEVLYHELLYKSCLELGKKTQAEAALQFLLQKFPQNVEYLSQYQHLNLLQNREVYIKARQQFKSKIARVYELCYIEDSEDFKKQFGNFIKPYFQKNLISLFTEVQVVYEAGKYALIEETFLDFQKSLTNNLYPDGTQIVSPSQYLWSLYLLAQHYSLHFENLPKAYEYIKKAIGHTCTVTEFYLVKADIEYKQHNNLQSLKTINEARKTDLADRYMNNICVKYLMKCEQSDLGENVLRIFMRDEASLYELQNHWYIIEAGKSLLKQRNLEAGLRHLDFISKQFIDFQGNQFDFHTYCIRRWTLREYTELIQFNDNIYDDKKYVEAAGFAIKYLQEYVHKSVEDQKLAKAQEVKEEEKESKKKKKKKKVNEVTEETPQEVFRKKIDYSGKQYSEKIKKNPIEQALNYAKCVSTIKYTNKGNANENRLFGKAFEGAIDIFIHFKKPLLVLRLLNKLNRTKYCPFSLHFATLKAILYFQSYLKDPKANDIAKQLIIQFLDKTLLGKSIGQYNETEVSKWNTTVNSQYKFLIQAKSSQASLILKSNDLRTDLIDLYIKELARVSGSATSWGDLSLVFYYTHKLQFYGRLSPELKSTLNKVLSQHTTYFSDWRSEISKLPESTWSQWWLSDYDIERQELEEKQAASKK